MKDFFQKNGYVIVRQAISEELRDFVAQYALFDELQDPCFEGTSTIKPQVGNSHSKYADPAMETLLLHLKPAIEEQTGLKLFPTYSYYRVYRNGHELKPHVDRPSCEISATLCLNVNYDVNNYVWPIYIDGVKVELNPGDLVIYRGCDIPHWRTPLALPEKVWHIQGFFHYVDADGPYVDWKFDQRPMVGHLKNSREKKSLKSYITFK